MYVILIAIVIFGLSQEPAKTPESKGPSKANGAEIAKQIQSTDRGDHQAANAPLVPSEVTIGTQYNMESIPHDDHAQMADKERNEQDLKIQGQLALFTGLLVLVGLLQLGALVWQARVFNEHKAKFDELAKAATSNASAALLQATAIINVERPWIVVEVEWIVEPLAGYIFKVVNKGQTPAEVVSAYFEHEFSVGPPDNLPIPPHYHSPVPIPHRGDNLLVKDEEWPLNIPIHIESWMDNTLKKEAVMNAAEFPVFYGEIIYRDMLHGPDSKDAIHTTRWCFVYNAFLKMLSPSGSSQYRSKS